MEIYTNKEVLSDALISEKTATTQYNAYSNECVHDNVRDVMLNLLEKEHDIQNEVFNMMHSRGLYPTPEAENKKVQEAKDKYSCGYKATV